jgi:hypothetical protein
MHIRWQQKAWHRNTRAAYKWEGTRSDGRSFRILWVQRLGYLVESYNGTRLGTGKSLAEAQAIAEKCPGVKVAA